jgi:DNA polymerase III alpha subunit (gram-positive type)
MNPLIPFGSRDILFVDSETSGLDPDVHEILDWAAVRFSADLQTEKARCVTKCSMQWPDRAEKSALEINRYDAQEWRGAPPVRSMLIDFGRIVDDDLVIIGHNIHFDLGFVQTAYRRESLALPKWRWVIDTMGVAWPLAVAGHLPRMGLNAICSKYGVENVGAHRAYADVVRNARAYAKMLGLQEPKFKGWNAPKADIDPFAETGVEDWAR